MTKHLCMKKIYTLFLFCLAIFSGNHLRAQVTVTATSGTLTATYTTVKAAFDAINAGTHKGDIYVDLTASTVEGTTPATLNSFDADPTSYNFVQIQPLADNISISGNPGAGFGVIQLNGADNVIISGDNPNTAGTNRDLSIINTSAASAGYTSCIRLATLPGTDAVNADNNFIFNCNLVGNVTGGNAGAITGTTTSSNTSFGIYCGGKGSATTPTAITSETADAALSGTTIENLFIDNVSVTQCARGIVFNGAVPSVSSNLTITNSVIGASGALGIYPFSTPASTVYTKGIWIAGCDGLSLSGNTIQNILSYVGTNISGIELASNIGSGVITIDGNTIAGVVNNGSASSATGILISSASNKFDITSNIISSVQSNTTTSVAGIQVATTGGQAFVSKNIISNVFNRNVGGYGAFGVHLSAAATGAEISNNFIYDLMNVGASSFTPAFAVSGIYVAAGTSHKIWHNSVNLTGASTATSSNMITCFSVLDNTITGLDIRNNIFSNTVSGGTASDAHVCMYFPYTASTGVSIRINNNAYYTGSIAGRSGVAFAGATTYALANLYDAASFNAYSTTAPAGNFRVYSSGLGISSNDFASFATTAAAPFTSASDLHIVAGVTMLESGGSATSVTQDIDGGGRGTFPDIGADEFTGTKQDLIAPLITYTPLTGTCVLGARVLTANIVDQSGVPTSGAGLPVLYWRINAGAYNVSTGVSIGAGNYNFALGGGAVVGDVVSYYIVAQDGAGTPNVISEPSNGAAGFTANIPAAGTPPATLNSYTVQSNLAPGTYTVGAAGTYPTLTAAVNAYNNSCLSGAVIFSLIDAAYSGAETFPISIGNPSASAVNTLTIRPAAGVNATITGTSATAIIKLNGADYVTIDGSNNGSNSQNLTISNTDAGTTSAVIWVANASSTNGATNNTVKNCIVMGNSSTTTYAAIVSSGAGGTGTNAVIANSSNTYQNNNLNTAFRGIALLGPSTGDNNNTITSNKVGSTIAGEKIGFRGIYISNQNNVSITSNTVLGINSSATSRDAVPAGITVQNLISNGVINNNIISDCKNTSTGGWPAHGITLQSSSANSGLAVYNNFIYDVAGFGWASIVSDNGHGIGILGGGGYKIYYNSVNLTTNQSISAPTAAIFIDNRTSAGITPVNLNIRNNIFSNQQTTGTRYAIYSLVPASSFTAIDYNDYYSSGSNLGYLGGAANTLAAWQAVSLQDLNSVAVNPVFISSTNLHLTATSPGSPLDGLGTVISGFTNDIDGNVRNFTTPDIGADEFTPDPCGGIITAGTAVASKTTICVSSSVVFSSTGFSTGTGLSYAWQSSPDNISWSDIAGEINPAAMTLTISTGGYYRLRATCSNNATTAYSNVILLTVNTPSITGTTGGTVCGQGTVGLSATGSAGTTVYWYSAATGGTPLTTGNSYTTPLINAPTNYYVEAVSGAAPGSVGPLSPTAQGGTIGTQTVTWQVYFDVIQATTLVSIDVFPLTSGQTSTINVYNSGGTIIGTTTYTTTVSGGATAQTVPINVSIPVGSGYYLYAPGGLPSGGLTRNVSGAAYPYTSSAINITGNAFDQTYYMGYYNWQFSSGCPSAPRVSVLANVTAAPGYTAPVAAPAVVCEGASSNITGFDADYSTYSWAPATGLSNASIANPVATPAATTTYTVTVSNGVCATSANVTVTVNPVPGALTIAPAGPVSFCAGTVNGQSLTATGGAADFFRERFESFPVSKFTVSDSRITAAQSTTYYQEGTSSVRLSYVNSIPDADPAAYALTNSINLSLYNNPVLTFKHICALENTGSSNWDFGYVEYSTDNGSSWTPFPTSSYTGSGTLRNGVVCFEKASYADWNAQFTSDLSTPGAGPATSLWKLETLNLSPWQSETQFKIRFRIKSDGSVIYYGWLLDDVKINAQATITWSPTTDLFTNLAASTPYTGTNTPTVYTKPTANRTYVASAAFGSCGVTQAVVVNYTSNPISLTIASAQGTSNICGADTVDLSIPVQNTQGGTVFYDWKKNGTTITGGATGGSSVGTTITVASTATLFPGMRVSVTAGAGFLAANTRIVDILNATQFTVSALPSVALSGATISAVATGSTVTSLRYSDLANGDVITCVLSVSGVTCVPVNPETSNALTFGILATTATSVTISTASTTVCASAPVTFNVSGSVNPGASPTYEWFINGVSQGAPSASTSFTTSALTNGQVVNCRMYSDATNCPFPKAPYSNNITMTVNPSFPVSVSITSSPAPSGGVVSICNGTSVTFTATPTNGGVTPSYQWYVGATPVGTNSPTYTTTTLADLDVVTCVLTSSISSCALGNPATSNALNISVTTQTASVTITPATPICAGISRTYTATPTNGGATPGYQWYVNSSPVGTSSTYTYTPVDGDVIAVDMSSSLSCATPVPATTSITQTVYNNPTASISGSTSICTGSPATLTASAVAGSGTITTYQWTQLPATTVGTNNPVYATWTAGSYTVTVTNSNGCSYTTPAYGPITSTVGAPLSAGTYTIGTVVATASGASAGTTINVASTAALQVGQAVGVTSGSATGVFANGIFTATAPAAGTTITVGSTVGLVVGQTVNVIAGTGAFASGTTVASILTATTFSVTAAPATALTAGAVISANTVITSVTNATQFVVSPAPSAALSAGATITGATCNNYLSFLFAITDLNNKTISAPTTFNVTPGYVENLTSKLPALGNGGLLNATVAARSLTFQKNGAGANPRIIAYTGGVATPASAVPDGIFTIAGTDNVTIDGIDLSENAANTGGALMEYGYGLFKFAAGDGVQNATIKNCVITLDKANNTVGTAPMPDGSTGVLLINATPTAATTALVPTNGGTVNTNGSNSSNKFYSNTIQNCNTGISMSGYAAVVGVGPTPTAATFLGDLNNDAGGAVLANGNTIQNFGSGGANPATAIRATNQWGVNVSYNTINNNVSITNHTGTLRGIFTESGLSANATITNNNITVRGGGTTSVVYGINNAIGSTALGNTVQISNNTITGSFTTSTTGAFAGIINSASPATLNMNNNIIQNVTLTSTSGALTGITTSGAAGAVTMNGNQILNLSSTSTGNFIGLESTTAITGTYSISNNSITGNTKIGTGTMSLIAAGAPTGTLSINSNTISGNTVTGGSAVVTFNCIINTGTSTYSVSSNTIDNNYVTGMSGGAAVTLLGYTNNGGVQNETISGNTISNLYVTGTSTGLHIIRAIQNNTSGTSVRTVNNNNIFNLYTNAGSSAVITGIITSLGGSGTPVTIYNNRIYNLFPGQSATAGSIAKGISVTTGTNVNIYNNMIAIDLSLAASATSSVAANSVLTGSDAVRGIEITSALASATYRVYYNSIRLAGNGGTGFGSSAMFHTSSTASTTAALDMRNNILDNECTPNGGLVVAFRRSAGTANSLQNYAAASNNNLFYAGTPGASNLIYTDGTSSAQTIAAYKAGVFTAGTISPRDQASVSDKPNFTTATNLLLIADNNCIMEGKGTPIAGFNDDIEAAGVRSATTPDIGADEFSGTNPVTLTVTSPGTVCSGTPVDLTAAAVTAGSSGGTQFYYYTDAAGTIVLPTPNNVLTSGTYYIKYGKGSCYSAVTPVVVTVIASGTWLGIDNNWNNSSNWCGGIPTSATNIIIPGALSNYPIISSGVSALANNVTIAAGASVTTTGTGSLDIKGAFTNNGTLANWGEIKLTGTGVQTFPGATGIIDAMTRLTINNTSGANPAVTLNRDMLIREAIIPTAGIVNLNNVYITLRSNVDSTARVGTAGTGSFTYTGTGNFVIERYFPGKRAWRLLTAPVTASNARSIFNSWQAGSNNSVGGNATFVTGPAANPATNGLDVSPANNYSLKRFNYLTSGFDGIGNTKTAKIPAMPSGATASYLTDTTGYFVFVRGDRTASNPDPFNPYVIGNSTVLRDTGSVKTGTFTYNCNPGSGAHIYSLIGNPYASAVDFTSLTRNNLANKFQAWDPTLGSVGGWAVWNGGSVTPVGSVVTNIIQSKQAFVVEATGAAPSLTFGEAAKSSLVVNTLLFRPAPLPTASLNANLYFVTPEGSNKLADGALLRFDDAYDMNTDHLDAVKFSNVNETFSIKNSGNYFIQEYRPYLQAGDTVFFNFARARQFKYKFNFTLDEVMKEKNKVAYLNDKFTGTATPLNMKGETWVEFEVNGNSASAAADRFFVTFKRVAKLTGVHAAAPFADVLVDWSAENASLIDRFEVERSADGKVFEKVGEVTSDAPTDISSFSFTDPGLNAGYYYYRIKAVSSGYNAYDYSEMVKVKVTRSGSGMYVYPNPVINGVIGLRMPQSVPAGKYTVRVLNTSGTAVAAQQLQHTAAVGTELIRYPSYLAAGAYQLEVTGSDHKKTVINIVIQKQ